MQKESKRTLWITMGIYLAIFAFMLVLNVITIYISDDFSYSFSFWDKERMRSLSQIFMSMRAHRYSMNGRLVAHTLVQILAMLPLWVFDIINALMFVLQIALIQKIAGNQYPRSNAMLAAIFFAVWLTCPSFGQVNLWQDGACNYLWSIVLGLLFLLPYVQEFVGGKTMEKRHEIIVFLCLSFVMGAYSENTSSAAIGMAGLLVLLMLFWQKRKFNKLWAWSIALAVLGYLSIYTAPAQVRGKAAVFSFEVLWNNFLYAARMYGQRCGVLFLIFVLAFLVNLVRKTDRKQQLLGLVFLCGSLAANFIMTFAEFYITRSAMAPVIFLVAADAVILYPLVRDKLCRRVLAAGFIGLTLLTAPAFVEGVSDIYDTYQVMKQNEIYLYECQAQGMREATVPNVKPRTEYSPAKYLNYVPSQSSMARFFGMDAIWAEEEQ